jgi:hypothetical protein
MVNANTLLSELTEAGQHPDRALLDRVKARGTAVVPSLIALATDEALHFAGQDSPAIWAPLHAIQLLGELGAAEAAEPLLPLFDWQDDDWLAAALKDAFGRIGRPAVGPLRQLLSDRGKDIWTRARVASALTGVAEHHPQLRAEVVAILTARLDDAMPQTPDDGTFNAFVIGELLNLQATEAMPAIQRAFDAGRVDRFVVDEWSVRQEFGLPAGWRRRRLAVPGRGRRRCGRWAGMNRARAAAA